MVKTVFAIMVAVTASICVNYSLYLQKIALDVLPQVKLKLSWSLLKAFLTNIPWLKAQGFNVLGFALYMTALAFAPVSIVEPIIAAGVALLAYLAIKNLGERPGRLDMYAIGGSILGVILLGVSLAEGLPEDQLHDPMELWAFTGAIVLIAVVAPLVLRSRGESGLGTGLGISAGLFIGIAAVFSRLLMGNFSGKWYVWIVACIATYLPGFILLQAALQRGMAVVVAPVYNGIMEFVPILVGMVALNERFPESFVLSAIRVVAFVLILACTLVLSRRAEETGEGEAGDIK
jgi:drug/metabolite transporter (DMT)-like permease